MKIGGIWRHLAVVIPPINSLNLGVKDSKVIIRQVNANYR
jgi:hypothetical protein